MFDSLMIVTITVNNWKITNLYLYKQLSDLELEFYHYYFNENSSPIVLNDICVGRGNTGASFLPWGQPIPN